MAILENSEHDAVVQEGLDKIRNATSFADLYAAFTDLFGVKPTPEIDAYKDPSTPYGSRTANIRQRRALNKQAIEIINSVNSADELTPEQREILLQYSGAGGRAGANGETSLSEYYTPAHVAEGMWDALKAYSFTSGNVLDPSCGAGVFSGTKPEGFMVTGNDISPVSSKIAALLNPDDNIREGSFEKIATRTEDDLFDACVTNVPFGDRGASIADDPDYKEYTKLEDYFVLRILKKIKPGGLACLLVPTQIVSGKNKHALREKISRMAEFLGAHKLPSKTFKNNGTDVVTDIIVLRKHTRELKEKVDSLQADDLYAANVLWEPFLEGRYWQTAEGKQTIMGKYVPADPTKFRDSEKVQGGNITNQEIKQRLARRFESRINWEMLNAALPVIRNYGIGDRKYIDNQTFEFDGLHWNRIQNTDTATPIDAATYGAATEEGLIAMLQSPQQLLQLSAKNMQAVLGQDKYRQAMPDWARNIALFALTQEESVQEQALHGALIGTMIDKMVALERNGEDVSQERDRLQEIVTAEIDKYGHPKNGKLKAISVGGANLEQAMSSFATFKNAIKADGSFSDALSGNKTYSTGGMDVDTSNPAAIVSYLCVRKDQDTIWLDDIQKLYTGDAPLTSLGDLAAHDNIAISPDGTILPINRYCSGDVYAKMAACADAIANTDDDRLKNKYREQIEYMEKRLTKTKVEDIQFGLRQKWLPQSYVLDFFKDIGWEVKYGAKVGYLGQVELDEENPKNNAIHIINAPFSMWKFKDQLEKYLNGGKISGKDKKTIADNLDKLRSIEKQFQTWMLQRPELGEIEEMFNRKMNSSVPCEYEGDSLGIEEYLSGKIIPHNYQNSEVRRLAELGSGICGYGTGLGKTTTALALAAYNDKKGHSKKTCIVVPNAVLENWYHEAHEFYNEDWMRKNIYFVGLKPVRNKEGAIKQKPILDENSEPKRGKDGSIVMQDDVKLYTGQGIIDDLHTVKNNNHKIVVMTKETFGRIPLQPESYQRYADDMKKNMVLSDDLAGRIAKGSYDSAKQDAKRERMASDRGTKNNNTFPFLEDLDFDSIIADEAHFFKNSIPTDKDVAGIAYLPDNPKPSQIAVDMMIKSHYIRSKSNGRGVYGLSATPVTNSPIEIFNMLSLVCPPEEFARMGIYTVRDFVSVFGDIQATLCMTVSCASEERQGLVGFKNLDGLRNFFKKYVSIKTYKDIEQEVAVPVAEEYTDLVEMNEEQSLEYEVLRHRALAAKRARAGGDTDAESIFTVIRDMDRVTTDIDLYRHEMTFVFPEKYSAEVTELLRQLPDTVKPAKEAAKEGAGRDIAVDKTIGDAGHGLIQIVVPETLEKQVVALFAKLGIDESEVSHPIMPKYAQLIENLKKHFDRRPRGRQIIFTEEKSQHHKIERILVHNLPVSKKQIGIINAEDAAGEKLDAIAKRYNSGGEDGIKIIIANKKAEVGVNLQKGTVAIHHLTFPWTPASINQRNGRGVRQGNKEKTVSIYYYCGKKSFDVYRMNTLKRKARWIGDLLNGSDTYAENGDAISGADIDIMLADDPEAAAAAAANNKEAILAKKAAEAVRQNKIALGRLRGILQNLANHDANKEADKSKLEDKKFEIENNLKRNEERLYNPELSEKDRKELIKELNSDDVTPERAEEIKERLYHPDFPKEKIDRTLVSFAKYRNELRRVNHSLSHHDEQWQKSKERQEKEVLSIRGTLNQVADEGRLPFDRHLIDDPSDAVLAPFGELFVVGEQFETKAGEVAKVIGILNNNKGLKIEALIDSYGQRLSGTTEVSFEKLEPMFKNKCSYSESELRVKELTKKVWSYGEIFKEHVDKELFMAHASEIVLNEYYGCVYYLDGKIVCHFDDDPNDKGFELFDGITFVYPEPDNEVFKKAVCTQFMEKYNACDEGYKRSFGSDLMRSLFGPDYLNIAKQYGESATDRKPTSVEVVTAVIKQWNSFWGAAAESHKQRMSSPDYNWEAEEAAAIFVVAGLVKPMLPNADGLTIDRTVGKLVHGKFELIRKEVEQEKVVEPVAEDTSTEDTSTEDTSTEDTNAESDDTKKLHTLKERGIHITTLVQDRRHPQWIITDTNGYGGPVFQSKEMLKGFSGKFKNGSWIVPKDKATLAELYAVIAPNLTATGADSTGGGSGTEPEFDFSVVNGNQEEDAKYEELLQERGLVIRHDWKDGTVELHDTTFKGPLYRAKEDLKRVFKARFKKDTYGKGWWVVPEEDGIMHKLHIVLSKY